MSPLSRSRPLPTRRLCPLATRRALPILLALLALPACSDDNPTALGTGEPGVVVWGHYGGWFGDAPGEFDRPGDLAVGPDDVLYVLDAGNDRIQVFDADGSYLRGWGVAPVSRGIATDAGGNVYSVSSGTGVLTKFDASGGVLTTWGGIGSAAGEFSFPSDVAVDPRRLRVYVPDAQNNRIQVFTTAGDYIEEWASQAFSIAVDVDGNIYAVDLDCRCVRKYSDLGNEILSFGGSGPGELAEPAGVAAAPDGTVWVSDFKGPVIRAFTGGGDYVTSWGALGSGDGEMSAPAGVAVNSSGDVYVSDQRDNHRVTRFGSDGTFMMKIGRDAPEPGTFAYPSFMAVDGNGNVYATDAPSHRVQKFSSKGRFVTQWGRLGYADGEFNRPAGIAVHGDAVYVADALNHRVQRFDREGVFVAAWGSYGFSDGQFGRLGGITTDAMGLVYVADGGKVQKFTADGTFVSSFFAAGFVQDLAVDAAGNVYVTSSFADGIATYDTEGNLVGQWGIAGDGPGELDSPFGISVDAQGDVFVCDTFNNRVQKFHSDGEFIARWGSGEDDSHHLERPEGVECWRGRVFVADSGNYRLVSVPEDRWAAVVE